MDITYYTIIDHNGCYITDVWGCTMKKYILIVEDNTSTLFIQKTLMENLGCKVDCAETGEIAVDLFERNTYDLILMDIGLPGMDGIEATHQIRAYEQAKRLPLTPIVAVTAESDPVQHEQYIAAGMKEVSTKPFTLEAAQYILLCT